MGLSHKVHKDHKACVFFVVFVADQEMRDYKRNRTREGHNPLHPHPHRAADMRDNPASGRASPGHTCMQPSGADSGFGWRGASSAARTASAASANARTRSPRAVTSSPWNGAFQLGKPSVNLVRHVPDRRLQRFRVRVVQNRVAGIDGHQHGAEF